MMTRSEDATIKHSTPESDSESGYIFADDSSRRKYFKRLKHVLQIGLLIAYLIPITILTIYFSYKFNASVRESASLHLAAVAESQRNTIALYMQKRIVNIFNLFHPKEFSVTPAQEEMDDYLANLLRPMTGSSISGFWIRRAFRSVMPVPTRA
jgi:two-component system, NtrC family, sensor kinase